MSFIIHCGDALDVLRTLPDQSVHCCVTSPPYWGLRDYGTGQWVGGLPDCEHKNLHGTQGKSGERADRAFTGAQNFYRDQCAKCGAVRVDRQIGLEKTPEEYVGRLVEVFREVKRVLSDDATLWVNMGDSFFGGAKGNSGNIRPGDKQATNMGSWGTRRRDTGTLSPTRTGEYKGLKVKDLCGIPWRLALALQADGWWLRSDIVWCKSNGMPESVRDRPTKAHEYIFLLAKSERYYYDAEAVKEPASADTHARYARGRSDTHWANGGPGNQTIAKSFEHMRAPGVNPKCAEPGSGIKQNSSFSAAVKDIVEFRNKRSWWVMNSLPTPEADFATFPIELPETCILAGSPEGGTVLDPFAGAGTTALAALKHGRKFIGIELNPDYIEIARKRLREKMPLFAASVEDEKPLRAATSVQRETERRLVP